MENSYSDRFKKRQKIKNSYSIYEKANDDLVNKFLNSSSDTKQLDEMFDRVEKFYDTSVSDDEAKEFLDKFKKDFSQDKFDKLIVDCKNEVIKSIVTPFGLGKIVAAYDKTGGNVDTINNVREGIYSSNIEKFKYENIDKYDTALYHSDKSYTKINERYSNQKKIEGVKDYLTGETLNNNSKMNLDHIVSANEIHNDRGRVLAEINGIELANKNSNLSPTNKTINQIKNIDSMNDYIKKKNERLKNIEELEARESLTPQEENELRKSRELQKVDDEKALKADERARKEINSKINKAYYTSEKFAKNIAITGLNEGTKMGLQQALGVVIVEFFTAVFDEIMDIYKNGYSANFEDDSFLNVLKERLKRIGIKIKDKWKDVVVAFKGGFISGFISNLVTTFINVFVTTGKRLVRIIREGFFLFIEQ